jgi:hypothetical protein
MKDYTVRTNTTVRFTSHRGSISSGYCCRFPDKGYNSLVAAFAFVRDAGIYVRFLTFCICRWHQAGFGAEHIKNGIRKCCCQGKRTRPDTTRRKALFGRTYHREKAVSVPLTFHFLHPAARASSRFIVCWWDISRGHPLCDRRQLIADREATRLPRSTSTATVASASQGLAPILWHQPYCKDSKLELMWKKSALRVETAPSSSLGIMLYSDSSSSVEFFASSFLMAVHSSSPKSP